LTYGVFPALPAAFANSAGRGYHEDVFQSDDKPLEEREYPDQADLDEPEDEEEAEAVVQLVNCPACGELVYDQAQQCPHCKEWLVPPGRGWRQSRKWYVRSGLYLTKTILLNWLFWLALGAIAAISGILALLKDRR